MQKILTFFMGMMFFVLVGHGVCAAPQHSRTLEFDYEIYLKDIPEDASELKVWAPILPKNERQIIEKVSVDAPFATEVLKEGQYGNKVLHFTVTPPFQKEYKVTVHYAIKRLEYSTSPNNKEDLTEFLQSDRLVTLSPRIKKTAKKITRGKKTTLEKARAIYDYVLDTVAYDKSIPGYGYGDTERVCDIKAGNCTDFHSLFMSLARASGIPANFIIGVPLKNEIEGEVAGYHCWAEFHDTELGWVPVDISEAWKDKTRTNYYFGTIGENRLEFSQGRDIVLEPKQAGEPLNYFVYPYAELDGELFKKVGIAFKYKDVQQEKTQQVKVNLN